MNKCTDCGVERWKLHRHHVAPKSQGGKDDTSNVVLLCANCHEDRHGGPKTDSLPWQLAHTPEAKAKRSASIKRLWRDPEYKAKQHQNRLNAWARQTPEQRAKRGEATSRALKGKSFTTEHRAALSKALKGRANTPEQKAKISAALKGRVFTAEHRAKISAALKARGIKPPGYSGIKPIIKTCAHCGKGFETGGRGRPKRSALYCSNQCSGLAREALKRIDAAAPLR